MTDVRWVFGLATCTGPGDLRRPRAAVSTRGPDCVIRGPRAGDLADGQDLTRLSERGLARLRRDAIGFVFQAVLLLPLAICHELRADLDAGNGSIQDACDYGK
jgi:hypothetical protein